MTTEALADWPGRLHRLQRLAAQGRRVEALAEVVSGLRPERPADERGDFEGLLICLRSTPEGGAALGQLLRDTLREATCVDGLTNAGIPSDRGFLDELLRKIGRRLLPEVDQPGDLRAMIRAVFSDEDDYRWLAAEPLATWQQLLDLMGLTAESVQGVGDELASSIRVLAHHAASLGLHPYITERLHHLDDLDSPFLALSHHVLEYLESFENDVPDDEEPLLERALATIEDCRAAVLYLRQNKHRYGTSLRLTTLSHRLLRKLDRLVLLLHLSEPVERGFQASAVRVFQALVEAENTRNHVGRYVRNSADLLALQVVEHAAKKGAKYITRTWREYGRFFLASLGGGFIVAVFALFKVLLDKLHAPLAVDAILFGLNYSVCFVMIHLTGSALATKQPAMTANTIARTIGEVGREHHLDRLAELVVRVWRSQFVSFAGNLLCALPASLLMCLIYEWLVGTPPIPAAKADALIAELHPWRSGSLVYAAFAGVFLFSAGLVSGYCDNRNLYRNYPKRVARHPWLVRWVGSARAARVGDFVDQNLGILAGNVFLGFCLGSAGTVGVILGLPFDIRHIAFAASHFGMALEALHGAVPMAMIVQTAVGVALIGLVNFVVSFYLAVTTALESRQVTFDERRALLKLLLGRLVRRPWEYLVPPLGAAASGVGPD